MSCKIILKLVFCIFSIFLDCSCVRELWKATEQHSAIDLQEYVEEGGVTALGDHLHIVLVHLQGPPICQKGEVWLKTIISVGLIQNQSNCLSYYYSNGKRIVFGNL